MIEFRIYDITNSKSDNLNEQTLLGKEIVKLDYLVDNENSDIEIVPCISNRKGKIILKANCVEYDGGNSKYEIGL
jgi:hypothetical protein